MVLVELDQDQRPGPPMGQYGSAGLTSWCPRVTASLVSGQCVGPGQESRTAGGEEERRRARAPHSRPCPGRAGRVSRRQPAVTAGLGLGAVPAPVLPACLVLAVAGSPTATPDCGSLQEL